jgi:ankyrin repeat protein
LYALLQRSCEVGWTRPTPALTKATVLEMIEQAGLVVDLDGPQYRREEGDDFEEQWRPVHLAARGKSAQIMRALVRRGVNIHAVTSVRQQQPLHHVATLGHEKVLQVLIEAGAAIDALDWMGFSALSLACAGGHQAMVKQLLTAGAAPDPASPASWVRWPLQEASMTGRAAVVEMLLAAGARIEATGLHGRTALHVAAEANRAGVVRVLAAAGANLEAKMEIGGLTPLMLACHDERAEALAALIEAGADIEVKRADGATPLYVAARDNLPLVVKQLVAAGVDIHAPKDNGWTPLQRAFLSGDPAVVMAMLQPQFTTPLVHVHFHRPVLHMAYYQPMTRPHQHEENLDVCDRSTSRRGFSSISRVSGWDP